MLGIGAVAQLALAQFPGQLLSPGQPFIPVIGGGFNYILVKVEIVSDR